MVNTPMLEYKVEDIFEDDPDNPDNVLMKIPDEILESQGWKVGDKLKFDVGDKGTIIITKPEEAKEDDQNVIVITQPE